MSKKKLDHVEAGWDSIAADAYRLVHGDRGALYDHPAVDYARTVDIFRSMTGYDLTPEEGVLFMVAVKLSRIVNGLDEGFPAELLRDSVVDAAGYLECLYGVLTWHPNDDDTTDNESEEDE